MTARLLLARVCAANAVLLMVLSAILLRPARQPGTPDSYSTPAQEIVVVNTSRIFPPGRSLNEAGALFLGGGVLLIAARFLAGRDPVILAARPLRPARAPWWLVGAGYAALFVLADANGGRALVGRLSAHVQFALLAAGIALIVAGLGGKERPFPAAAGGAPHPVGKVKKSAFKSLLHHVGRGFSANTELIVGMFLVGAYRHTPLHANRLIRSCLRGGATLRWQRADPSRAQQTESGSRGAGYKPAPTGDDPARTAGVLTASRGGIIPAETLLLALITLAAFALRVWNLGGAIHAFVDELNFATGVHWFEAVPDYEILRPISGVVAFPRVYTYLEWHSTALLGHTLAGLRLTSAVIGALTIPAVYLLGRALFDRPTGLIAAALLASFPPHLHYSRLAMNNIGDPLVGTLAFAFLACGMRSGRRRDYALAGAMLGLTQYGYEGGRVVFPAVMLAWIAGLALIGRRRPAGRGVAILALAAVLTAAPVYVTLLALDQPLLARTNAMIRPPGYWRDLLFASSDQDAFRRHLDVIRATFLIYIQRPEGSYFYGGGQPLVLVYVVPCLLLGAAAVVGRLRAPGPLLLALWIPAVSFGNSFMVLYTESPRYVAGFPALMLLSAVGLRTAWGLVADISPSHHRVIRLANPMAREGGSQTRPYKRADSVGAGFKPALVQPVRQLHHRVERGSEQGSKSPLYSMGGGVGIVRAALLAGIVIALAAGQAGYYFGPHLDRFNRDHRLVKPYPDGEDALFRSVDFPPGTQIHLISREVYNQSYARDVLTFLTHTDLTVETLSPLDLSARYWMSLRRDVDHAFFVERGETAIPESLGMYFQVRPPAYTRWDVPPSRQFVLYYAPALPPGEIVR